MYFGNQILRWAVIAPVALFTALAVRGAASNGLPDMLVASRYTDNVLRFDGTGSPKGVFASHELLEKPADIILGPDGRLYVAGATSDNVLRFDGQTGAFIDEFVSPGEGGLNGSQRMAFGPDGNFYIGSFWTYQVLRYNGQSGEFIDVFAYGGGLTSPRGIAFGPDGNLYVSSEGWDNLILRYNGATGAFIDVFASEGALDSPSGLQFGPDMFVSNGSGSNVLRYDVAGQFLGVFAEGGGLSAPFV